jgi:triacylglycerol esterase/lipase EstA (alpha/beta hydrolase family)
MKSRQQLVKYLFILFFIFATPTLFGSHHIYVIHGYGSPKIVMSKITGKLQKEGFQTTNYGYRSIADNLDKLGDNLFHEINNSEFDTVSFVTHSMGALVVRSMLRYIVLDKKFPVIYRIVMIAPPNKGADIADLYVSNKLLLPFLGLNAKLMTTDSLSYANQLPQPDHSEVGIISGVKGNEYGYNRKIKGDNDGRIKPEHTTLCIEFDSVIIHDEHTRLTQNPRVTKLVVEFMKVGKFLSKE